MMKRTLRTMVLLLALSMTGAYAPSKTVSKRVQKEETRFQAASVDDDSSSEVDSATDLPTTTTPNGKKLVMSKAIPFLECPPSLKDCDLAGNFGFDPLNFAKNKDQLWQYREAEVKHARLAMLAAVGWPLSEIFDRPLAQYFGVESILDPADRVPSLLNGGLERVSPVWWGFCLGLTAAIDMYGLSKARSGDLTYFPGKLGFDPMGLYPQSREAQKRVEVAEIVNGRIAMLAVLVYTLEEYFTNMGVVDETPFFFRIV